MIADRVPATRAPEAEATHPAVRRPSLSAFLKFERFSGLYVWVAIIVIFSIWIPQVFLTQQTVVSLAADGAVTMIVCIGLLFSLAAGGFDLSIGQNLGLSAVIVATLSTVGGWDPWLSLVTALLVSLVVGVINGFLVAFVGVNSLIATLAMTSILLAATRLISGQTYRGPIPDELRSITSWQPLGVPAVVIFAVVVALLAWYLLEHSPAGRRIYATGASEAAALLSGVRTKRATLLAFTLSGFGAGLAGVLLASKIGSVSPDMGPSYMLPAFAACFLGMTQVKPGRFNVWGTVLALYLLATGVKGLQLVGGQQWITDAFNGFALIAAVSVSILAARRAGNPVRSQWHRLVARARSWRSPRDMTPRSPSGISADRG